jgi:isoprenylcysteine carboxyl methyltransferase (ICMT) family protein YpbQ
MNTSDWVGTVGVLLILIAYFFSTFKWMSSQSKIFFALNTIGAAMTCYASYLIQYWPFAVLEGTWTIVSLIGWIRAKE